MLVCCGLWMLILLFLQAFSLNRERWFATKDETWDVETFGLLDMWVSQKLVNTDVFRTLDQPSSYSSVKSQAELSFFRAENIAKAYGECRALCALTNGPIIVLLALSIKDISHLSPRFWALHSDPVLCLDGAASTLLTIQYNLCLGTLSPFLKERKDLLPLAAALLKYRIM
jgi:hypothetical protein